MGGSFESFTVVWRVFQFSCLCRLRKKKTTGTTPNDFIGTELKKVKIIIATNNNLFLLYISSCVFFLKFTCFRSQLTGIFFFEKKQVYYCLQVQCNLLDIRRPSFNNIFNSKTLLIHFWPVFLFHTPWKHQKTFGFSGDFKVVWNGNFS